MKAMLLSGYVLAGAVFANEPTWTLNHGPDAMARKLGCQISSKARPPEFFTRDRKRTPN